MSNLAVLALCSLITIQVVRALPFVAVWTLAGKRPWACHVCMSVWTSLAWGSSGDAYRWLNGHDAWGGDLRASLAAAGLCYLALRFLDTKPPALP